MRKLVYVINLSIDGCFDHTKQTVSEELLDYHTNLLRHTDTLVYGRITYQLMVPYWPDVAKHPAGQTEADVRFAQAFESVDKVVFSKSLGDVADKRTSVVRTDLTDGIVKLKQHPGKDMLVGGVDLPSQLIALGLVDEFLFVISPTIAGSGRRLLEDSHLPNGIPLTLIDSTILKSGHVALRYVKS